MSSADRPTDPDDYVREHKETLVRIIKHGDDLFVRSLALAFLVEHGDDPQLHEIRSQIDEFADERTLTIES